MIIACPACSTRYVVPDNAIGIEGRTVRCAKCKHSWFQDGPQIAMDVAEPGEETIASSVPTAAAAAKTAEPETPPPPQPEPEEPVTNAPAEPPAEPEVDDPEPDQVADENETEFRESEPEPEPDATAPVDDYSSDERLDDDPRVEEAPFEEPAVEEPAFEEPVTDEPVEEPVAERADPFPSAPPVYREEHAPVAEPKEAYDDEYTDADNHDAFVHEPPFKPRRNPLKLFTWGAVAFAILAIGAIIALQMSGRGIDIPGIGSFGQPLFAAEQPGLELDFPSDQQERRELPNGTEFFAARGTITNIGGETRQVPPILIVLRDERDRVVFSHEVAPPKSELVPGESVDINEAVTDIPESAQFAEFGWASQ